MWPRLREQGYLGVLAKHSAGRRPAVTSARVWPGSSVLAAYGVCSDGFGSVSAIKIRALFSRLFPTFPSVHSSHSANPRPEVRSYAEIGPCVLLFSPPLPSVA